MRAGPLLRAMAAPAGSAAGYQSLLRIGRIPLPPLSPSRSRAPCSGQSGQRLCCNEPRCRHAAQLQPSLKRPMADLPPESAPSGCPLPVWTLEAAPRKGNRGTSSSTGRHPTVERRAWWRKAGRLDAQLEGDQPPRRLYFRPWVARCSFQRPGPRPARSSALWHPALLTGLPQPTGQHDDSRLQPGSGGSPQHRGRTALRCGPLELAEPREHPSCCSAQLAPTGCRAWARRISSGLSRGGTPPAQPGWLKLGLDSAAIRSFRPPCSATGNGDLASCGRLGPP